MLIIGHRGAPTYEPENTLRSFAKALELGVDMIELDVHALPTGEVIVIHDRLLDRTTNGHGLVHNHSFDAIRALDAGKGCQIPTLQEVLDLVDRRVPIIIEIKTSGTAEPVAKIIEDYVTNKLWRYDQLMVSSFNHPELLAFKTKHAPHIRIMANTANIPIDGAEYAEKLQAYAIVSNFDTIDEFLISDAHKRGLKVYCYTIYTLHDTIDMYRLGVDGIFTNTPDVSRNVIASLEAESLKV